MLHISDHIYGPLVFGQKVYRVLTPYIFKGYLLSLTPSYEKWLLLTELEDYCKLLTNIFPYQLWPTQNVWAKNQRGNDGFGKLFEVTQI